jgi:hypothetical protein
LRCSFYFFVFSTYEYHTIFSVVIILHIYFIVGFFIQTFDSTIQFRKKCCSTQFIIVGSVRVLFFFITKRESSHDSAWSKISRWLQRKTNKKKLYSPSSQTIEIFIFINEFFVLFSIFHTNREWKFYKIRSENFNPNSILQPKKKKKSSVQNIINIVLIELLVNEFWSR